MPISVTKPGSEIIVTGGTESVPATMADIYAADVAGGWGIVSEIVAGIAYFISSGATKIRFGDGATASYFKSLNELVIFDDGVQFEVYGNATLQLGELYGGYGVNGSTWRLKTTAHFFVTATGAGSFKMFGSTLIQENNWWIACYNTSCTVEIRDSRIQAAGNALVLRSPNTTLSGVFLSECGVNLQATPALFENVHTHRAESGITSATATVSNARVTSTVLRDIYVPFSGDIITLIDCFYNRTRTLLANANNELRERHPLNLQIVDAVDAAVDGATVVCHDQHATQVFSTTTDANGDIAEQIVQYVDQLGTSETETLYSPHTITISKTGFVTLILTKVDMSVPRSWRARLYAPSSTGGASTVSVNMSLFPVGTKGVIA